VAARRSRSTSAASPALLLEHLGQEALDVARKALKHGKNLKGDNFYGNKLLDLRAAAANAFADLSAQTAGDTAALVELIERVFLPDTKLKDRLGASRELALSLRTTWKQSTPAGQPGAAQPPPTALFPLTILTETKRGYLLKIGRQMNGCHESGWLDACAVMMRRLIELSIIEAFEGKGIANKVQDADGNFVQLSDLITAALSEPKFGLSRNTKTALPQLRDIGHRSAHGRYYTARPEDIERVRDGCRVVVEEFLHHAGLL
jgi:hypothetical protein